MRNLSNVLFAQIMFSINIDILILYIYIFIKVCIQCNGGCIYKLSFITLDANTRRVLQSEHECKIGKSSCFLVIEEKRDERMKERFRLHVWI